MTKPVPKNIPATPKTGQTFKPYDPQSTRVVHRRSRIEDAPSLIGGKSHKAPTTYHAPTARNTHKENL